MMQQLSTLPPIYVLPVRLDDTERSEIISNLKAKGCKVASSVYDARLFIGDVLRARRSRMELRFLGLPTNDVTNDLVAPHKGHILKVANIDWYKKVILEGADESFDNYVVYRGHYDPSDPLDTPRKMQTPPTSSTTTTPTTTPQKRPASPGSSIVREEEDARRREAILRRAAADQTVGSRSVPGSRHWGTGSSQRKEPSSRPFVPPKLMNQESTASHDENEEIASHLPDPPRWVKEKQKYACTRSTPMNPPIENKPFLDALFKIRLNRIIISDEVGVRAYSTAIAAIAAFPYPITHISQLHSMPGCEKKIGILWHEFKHSDPPGRLSVVEEIENSEYYKTLELFYNIWGAGAHTARTFYKMGFRDLDDLVENHWSKLTRVQQIGVKFYEEFENKIPRDEVYLIRDAVQTAARELLPGAEVVVVGGFRRGKELSNDVDLLVTHPQVSKSRDVEELLVPLVDKLELEELITHVLTIHTPSSNVASIEGEVFPKRSHHNFDGIPKVLCVWQQPDNDPSQVDAEGDSQMDNSSHTLRSKRKNPNPHRRVDILFPPPRCAGSTLTSWSGATTFERDLRRYVKATNYWKFSSEGITDRAKGVRVPIGKEKGEFIGLTEEEEAKGIKVPDDPERRPRKEDGEWIGWEIEEKKLFKVLGLEWRPAVERCTG